MRCLLRLRVHRAAPWLAPFPTAEHSLPAVHPPCCAAYMIIDPRPDWVQAVIDREKQPRSNCSEWVLKNQTSMYECLLVAFSEPPEVAGDYHTSLPIWLATFPAERFHIVQVRLGACCGGATLTPVPCNNVLEQPATKQPTTRSPAQYENLTTNQAAVLGDVERFVGLDPAHNRTGLPKWNSRCGSMPPRPGPQFWPAIHTYSQVSCLSDIAEARGRQCWHVLHTCSQASCLSAEARGRQFWHVLHTCSQASCLCAAGKTSLGGRVGP